MSNHWQNEGWMRTQVPRTYTPWAGDHFVNHISMIIQIWWKIGFSVIPLWDIILLQNFEHVMPAELWYHMPNFITITSLQFLIRVEWNFHRILITMAKSLVKWASGQCVIPGLPRTRLLILHLPCHKTTLCCISCQQNILERITVVKIQHMSMGCKMSDISD